MGSSQKIKFHVPHGDPCSRCGFPLFVHRVYHIHVGTDKCNLCGLPKSHHIARSPRKKPHSDTRPEHRPTSDPCAKCGLPASAHRTRETRSGSNKKTHKPIGDGVTCNKCNEPFTMHRKYRTDRQRTFFIGIDGEGQGRKNHRYVYLAASDEGGNRTWEVNGKHFDEESWKAKLLPEQIPTVECLEMILSLP